MADLSPRALPLPEAVAEYREAQLRHASDDDLAQLALSLDPEVIAWLDLIQISRRETMSPDPDFVQRLDHAIAVAPTPEASSVGLAGPRSPHASRSHAVNGRVSLANAQAAPGPRPRGAWQTPGFASAARMTATLFFLALIIGSVWAALYPLGVWDRNGRALLFPETTPAVAPTSGDVLLDLTLTDIPSLHGQGGIGVTRYPPGGSSREQAASAPEVLYIAAGPLNLTVEQAHAPVRVYAAGATVSTRPSRLVAVGEQVRLETGATVIAPPEALVALVNQGGGPATMLDLLWVSASSSIQAGGATWENAGSKPLSIESPARIQILETILGAGGSLPEPEFEAVAQAAALLDPAQRNSFRSFADGSIVNAGSEPMGLYVLRVTSNAGAANASTPTTAVIASGRFQILWESEIRGDGQLQPCGLDIDPGGNLWVCDANNERFHIFDPAGRRLETWGSSGAGEGEFNVHSPIARDGVPNGDIAFAADGVFYVADTGNFRVQKFAPDRSFLLSWGSEGDGDGQFLALSSVAVGPDGTVYVSDENQARIQAFDPDGRFLRSFAIPAADINLSIPAGMAVDAAGNIWLADFGANRILRFNPAGEMLSEWGTQGVRDGQLSHPTDVAVDRAGSVYVAERGNNRVQVFSPDGQFLETIGGFSSEAAIHFNDAVAVAVATDGTVYVADDAAIQAFRLRMERPLFGANPLLGS